MKSLFISTTAILLITQIANAKVNQKDEDSNLEWAAEKSVRTIAFQDPDLMVYHHNLFQVNQEILDITTKYDDQITPLEKKCISLSEQIKELRSQNNQYDLSIHELESLSGCYETDSSYKAKLAIKNQKLAEYEENSEIKALRVKLEGLKMPSEIIITNRFTGDDYAEKRTQFYRDREAINNQIKALQEDFIKDISADLKAISDRVIQTVKAERATKIDGLKSLIDQNSSTQSLWQHTLCKLEDDIQILRDSKDKQLAPLKSLRMELTRQFREGAERLAPVFGTDDELALTQFPQLFQDSRDAASSSDQ